VAGILDQHFMRSHCRHAVVEAFAATFGRSLDVIDRAGMDDGARRPGAAEADAGSPA
jgi:hypothetical protein